MHSLRTCLVVLTVLRSCLSVYVCGSLSLLRPHPCIHSAVKGLGEENNTEECTSGWMEKLKQQQREKEIVEKRWEPHLYSTEGHCRLYYYCIHTNRDIYNV